MADFINSIIEASNAWDEGFANFIIDILKAFVEAFDIEGIVGLYEENT